MPCYSQGQSGKRFQQLHEGSEKFFDTLTPDYTPDEQQGIGSRLIDGIEELIVDDVVDMRNHCTGIVSEYVFVCEFRPRNEVPAIPDRLDLDCFPLFPPRLFQELFQETCHSLHRDNRRYIHFCRHIGILELRSMRVYQVRADRFQFLSDLPEIQRILRVHVDREETRKPSLHKWYGIRAPQNMIGNIVMLESEVFAYPCGFSNYVQVESFALRHCVAQINEPGCRVKLSRSAVLNFIVRKDIDRERAKPSNAHQGLSSPSSI